MNPLLNGVNQNHVMQNVSRLKQAMQTMRSLANPKAMVNQMLQNNPNNNEIMKYINDNGGDVQKAFYAAAKDKGVNPEDILKALQQ